MRRLSLQRDEIVDLTTETLDQGGSLRFVAHGGSMTPFIRGGDELTVSPVRGRALKVGDVALYRKSSGGVVAHRVVAIQGQDSDLSFLVRGDAMFGPGEIISTERVLGRVATVQRKGKTWHLDRGPQRTLAQLWTRLSPSGPMLLRLSRAVKKVVS